MLWQLHFAGVLARQQAVLLGTFNGYELADNDNGYDEAAMVAAARARFGVPLFTGLPFGHCRDKLTLPVGGRCASACATGRPASSSPTTALSRHAGPGLQHEAEVDVSVALPCGSNERSMKRAPSRLDRTSRIVEQRVP